MEKILNLLEHFFLLHNKNQKKLEGVKIKVFFFKFFLIGHFCFSNRILENFHKYPKIMIILNPIRIRYFKRFKEIFLN